MARESSPPLRSTRRVFLKQQAALLACASRAAFALHGHVPSLAAAANETAEASHTKPGIDVLEDEYFAPLLGKRVGLITNQTGVDSRGNRTIDLLARENGLKLAAIFAPEHGVAGKIDGGVNVTNATDATTGVRVFSLFGETRRPTAEMLSGINALVFDMQDAGVRFYTYITTMAYAMEEAAKHQIPFFVLDRPNPVGGEIIEGPRLDPDRLSFVGYFPLPVRYAMTLGELAQMFNHENKIGADLHVIQMKNWTRRETYAEIGLAWIPPSPNLRTLDTTFLYPGLEFLQAGDVSVGRGTEKPFELFGAPWIRGGDLQSELARRMIPNVQFASTAFTPVSDLHAGARCEGVAVALTGATAFRSMRMGIEIADALHKMYPAKFQLEKIIFLLGSRSTLERINQGEKPASIIESWSPALDKFRNLRQKYLIY